MTPNFFKHEDEILESILSSIEKVLETQEYFRLCLSGGTSIIKTLRQFSSENIPWRKIIVYQTDERVVSLNSEHSNYYWIRNFLENTGAKIMPFYDGHSILRSMKSYNSYLNEYSFHKDITFDLLLLGFGEDGHIASLFSNSQNIKSVDELLYVEEKHNGFERISLSLAQLKRSECTYIISYGEKKLSVLNEYSNMPIHQFINGQKNITWFHGK